MNADDCKRVEVTLLDGPKIQDGSGTISLSPFQAAVVAAVFLSKEPGLNRAALISDLWGVGNVGPKERKRLSQILYTLRRDFGRNLVVSDGDNLMPGPDIVCPGRDLFLRAQPLNGLIPENFSSRFLGAIDPSSLPTTDSWVRRIDTWRRELNRSFKWASEALLAAGDLSSAFEHSRALIHHDGADELASINHATILVSQGKQQAACEHLRNFVTSQPLAPRARELLRTWTKSVGSTGIPFVGREDEVATILSSVEAAHAKATAHVILVSGESGVGKTRLVEYLEPRLQALGHFVLRGSLSEYSSTAPFGAIQSLLDGADEYDEYRNLSDDWRTLIDLFLLNNPAVPSGATAPKKMFEAFKRLLVAFASRSPTALIIDDFHNVDESSMAAIDHVCSGSPIPGLVLILTERPSSPWTTNIGRFAGCLIQRLGGEAIELAEFDLHSTGRLVAALSGSRAPFERSAEEVQSITGGNPLFIVELLSAGGLEGGVPDELPDSLQEVVARRTEGLSASARDALVVLAVSGDPLRPEALCAILDRPLENVTTSLEHLLERRLVEWSDLQGATVRHEIFREAIYRRLSPPRRALAHRDLVSYLERAEPKSFGRIAWHSSRSGQSEKTWVYSRHAAESARIKGALDEAIRYLNLARDAAPDGESASEVLAQLGELLYLQRNLESAVGVLGIAIDRLLEQGRESRAVNLMAYRADALSQLESIPPKEVLVEFSEVRERARLHGAWRAVALTYDKEASFRALYADDAGVSAVLDGSEECLRSGDAAAQLLSCCLSAYRIVVGDPEMADRGTRLALRLADRHPDLRLRALHSRVVVLLHRAELGTPAGQALAQKALQAGKDSGDLLLQYAVLSNLGVFYLDIFALPTALIYFENAAELIRHSTGTSEHLSLLCNKGEYYLCAGDPARARSYFLEAKKHLSPQTGMEAFRRNIAAGLGLAALATGDLKTARLQESVVMPSPLDESLLFDPSLVVRFKSRMAQTRGDREAAIHLLEALADSLEDRMIPSWLNAICHLSDAASRTTPARPPDNRVVRAASLAEKLGFREVSTRLERVLRKNRESH